MQTDAAFLHAIRTGQPTFESRIVLEPDYAVVFGHRVEFGPRTQHSQYAPFVRSVIHAFTNGLYTPGETMHGVEVGPQYFAALCRTGYITREHLEDAVSGSNSLRRSVEIVGTIIVRPVEFFPGLCPTEIHFRDRDPAENMIGYLNTPPIVARDDQYDGPYGIATGLF